MAALKNVQAGWKALEHVLNRIIDTVNSQTPIAGSGINIEERANGTTYSLADQKGGGGGGDSSQTNAGAGTGVAVTIQAFDSGNNPVTLTVMTDGSGFGTSTLAWQQITVVDPSTCAQSIKPLLGQASQ